MTPKNLGLTGLFVAFVIALPLFVWSAINVNFNIRENAQGEPNFCGGTCGSNYNCQANYFCFEGYCRNPICSADTDCLCNVATPTPVTTTIKPAIKSNSESKGGTATSKPTTKSSTKPTPTYTSGITKNLQNSSEPLLRTTDDLKAPENQFIAKYAIYIFSAFILIVISTIYYAIKKKMTNDIPHIMPPTNI
ncbi:MAG: hypothetical protein ACD_19C00426G0058 [uncultured bacterium]|nr:MAG: hypothetical protein ACD_19C00426G0058 [uncultured bacterium]